MGFRQVEVIYSHFVYVNPLLFLLHRKLHLHKPRKENDGEKGLELPGVTIAKPLASLSDPNLQENLSTFFTLKYPKVWSCPSSVTFVYEGIPQDLFVAKFW